jgi:hypothetical protein
VFPLSIGAREVEVGSHKWGSSEFDRNSENSGDCIHVCLTFQNSCEKWGKLRPAHFRTGGACSAEVGRVSAFDKCVCDQNPANFFLI